MRAKNNYLYLHVAIFVIVDVVTIATSLSVEDPKGILI